MRIDNVFKAPPYLKYFKNDTMVSFLSLKSQMIFYKKLNGAKMTKIIDGTGPGPTSITGGLDMDAKHPLFELFEPWYIEMQDAIIGKTAIEDADEDYLPMPGGMKIMKSSQKTAAYSAYQKRASYPEIVAPTIRGLAGVIHKDPIKPELPSALEYMIEKATTDGLTLEAALMRITRNVLAMGRTGIAIAIDGIGNPLLAIYKANAIRNWAEDESLVVLDESGPVMKENFSWDDKEKRLIIELIDGKAIATTYDKNSGWAPGKSIKYSAKGGNSIDFLPFVFVDTNDLTPDPDEVPLLPLARLAAKAYRQDANYQQTLYLAANPTHVIIGMDPDYEYRPQAVGGGVIWYLPDTDQKAQILEFTGASAAAQRQAIQDTLQAAVQAGARLFATSDEQQESGEARKIKYAAQTATLVAIAKTAAAGLEKVLKMCAVIVGANPDEVVIPISTDFIDSTIGAQEMTAIIQSVTGGLISEQTGYELFQNGGRANPDRDWEDEKRLIDDQAPALGSIGREENVNAENNK